MNRRFLVIGSICLMLVTIVFAVWYQVTERRPGIRTSESSMQTSLSPSFGSSPAEGMFASDMGYVDKKTVPGSVVDNSVIVPRPPATGGAGISTIADRMIIRTGSFSIVATDVGKASHDISVMVESYKGIVVSNQIYDMDTQPSSQMVVRVPVDMFNQTVDEIRKVGNVRTESIYGQDVTEEYVDLGAQLKNLQAAEIQFLEIMKRATLIQDILAVQRELTTVRGQIESMQGRMKYLSDSAEYATITIYISSDKIALPILDRNDEWKFVVEVKDALRALLNFAKEFIGVVVHIVIFAPVWGVVGLAMWFGIRKFRS